MSAVNQTREPRGSWEKFGVMEKKTKAKAGPCVPGKPWNTGAFLF
jgi:hypothetical protein